MGELATFQDAIDAGFTVELGQASYDECSPSGRVTTYGETLTANQFITKRDFHPQVGVFYTGICTVGSTQQTLMDYIVGISPVPTTLNSYYNNEFIEKSALIYPLNPANLYVMYYSNMLGNNNYSTSGGASASGSIASISPGQNYISYSFGPAIYASSAFSLTLNLSFGLSQYNVNDNRYERGIFNSTPTVTSTNLYTSVGYITSTSVTAMTYGDSCAGVYISVDISAYSTSVSLLGTIDLTVYTSYGEKYITLQLNY